MLDPAPTTAIAPHLARGTVARVIDATATAPRQLVLTFPNTSYELHLLPKPDNAAFEAGDRAIGTIRAEVKRLDTVSGGGKYLEPVMGRPRRIQGRVIATDAKANTVTIQAGVPVIATLTDPRQRAGHFSKGDFVTCGVVRGATFTPES